MTNREKIMRYIYEGGELGDVFELLKLRGGEKQVFSVVSATPYTNGKGFKSAIVTWLSECQTCGAGYEFTHGFNIQKAPKTCFKHRRTVRGGSRFKLRLAKKYESARNMHG